LVLQCTIARRRLHERCNQNDARGLNSWRVVIDAANRPASLRSLHTNAPIRALSSAENI
jgi:hypothetical protein